jgi:hypothetical protein
MTIHVAHLRWHSSLPDPNPRYPVFIPSRGRADTCITMRWLDRMGVPYRVIVEAFDFDAYAKALGPDRLLVLPQRYLDEYETCDPIGDAKGMKAHGPGCPRNYAWDIAVQEGAAWHWTMDDNIMGFYRIHRNNKIHFGDGSLFRCMEDFVARYSNIALAGPAYEMFAPRRNKAPPYILNGRIFSCQLIRTDAPFRWRCRYNDDVDLCLRMLKAGWCTLEFVHFLQKKMGTQRVPGGSTDTIYRDGTLRKSQLLVALHPDVAQLTWRYNRWHHHVDYARFPNKLVRLADQPPIPDYGLHLRQKVARAAP